MDRMAAVAGLAVVAIAIVAGAAIVRLAVLGSTPAAAATVALLVGLTLVVAVAASRSRPWLTTPYWR